MESRLGSIEETEEDIMEVVNANFIMLSLYRDYAIEVQKHPDKKEEYFAKMRQIKQDIKLLDHQELLLKVKKVYLPLFKKSKKLK